MEYATVLLLFVLINIRYSFLFAMYIITTLAWVTV